MQTTLLPAPARALVNKGDFDIEDEPGLLHVIAMSGGADSTALAVMLFKRFPHIKFRLLMSDTGAESEETMAYLETVSRYVGSPIEVIQGEYTLWSYIEKYGGYLPNSQSRWCTRVLKLLPFQKWMKQFQDRPVAMYVGIRADEPSRMAFDIPNVETVMPFKEMGWNRDMVFGFLKDTVGVPKTYLSRTRSGCTVCPFVRRAEIVSLYQRMPVEFQKGASYEKLSEEDAHRHQPGPPLYKDTGIAPNWFGFPTPKARQMKANSSHESGDMFGMTGIFAAVEFFFEDFCGLDPFVWQQRFISYSPTLAGMKKQVDARYEHLLMTAEVQDMSQAEVRSQVRFALYYLELPLDVFDVKGPNGGYTWQKGQSYKQIRHITDWIVRTLHASDLGDLAMKPVKNVLSVQYEWHQAAAEGTLQAQLSPNPLGYLVDSQWYIPAEPSVAFKDGPDDDLDVVDLKPCPMCTI